MSKYIGTPVVSLSVDTVDVSGDITATDSTPELILLNDTHEDTDGGREGKITFKGEQSGGEVTVLAQIQSGHDGTSDDEKGDLIFKTNDGSDGASPTERLRIDSTGKSTFKDDVGIEGATPTLQMYDTTVTNNVMDVSYDEFLTLDIDPNNARGNSGLIVKSDGNERMRIDSAGRVMIGTTTEGAANEAEDLTISSTGQVGITIRSTDSGGGRIYFSDGTSGTPEYAGYQIYNHSSNAMIFGTNAVERMSISSAGSTTLTSANDHPLILNRTGNTGVFAEFKEGGTSRGAIDGNGTRLLIRSIGSASGLRMDGGNITPFYGGGESDNGIDLGYSAGRFKTVFAGTGSINTSDENEKQDIAALTDAEITAAKAISKLFKTYKWKDAVSSKGDAARTHAGVIAQQVQTAMSDAGLDSSKYGFWCSDTWWEVTEEIAAKEAVFHEDGTLSYPEEPAFTQKETYTKEEDAPEGATKRTRMGIRYAELLAFVGAATEQRLTSIEARLTALEGE